jgi:hypothetical protein
VSPELSQGRQASPELGSSGRDFSAGLEVDILNYTLTLLYNAYSILCMVLYVFIKYFILNYIEKAFGRPDAPWRLVKAPLNMEKFTPITLEPSIDTFSKR